MFVVIRRKFTEQIQKHNIKIGENSKNYKKLMLPIDDTHFKKWQQFIFNCDKKTFIKKLSKLL